MIKHKYIDRKYVFFSLLILLSAVVSKAQKNISLNNADVAVNSRLLLDNPDKAWCYLKKSTTVIGLPFQPDVTSVTYDGALYTKYAELCFFYGQKNTPLLARQKTFLDGWIPVIQYEWNHNSIRYSIEMFADSIDGFPISNTVNFVKVTATNTGNTPHSYHFSVAVRGKLNDYRFGDLIDFHKNATYRISENCLFKDNKLLYTFPEGGIRMSIPDKIYKSSFNGDSLNINPQSLVGLTKYSKTISPKQTVTLVFKMPRKPINIKSDNFITALIKADYDLYKNKTIAYWKKLLGNTHYVIPEKEIEEAQRASTVHVLLATRTDADGHKMQTDGLPYPNFFLTSAPEMIMTYLTNNLPEYAKMCITDAVSEQEKNGLYFDKSLAHGIIIPAAHGQILYAIVAYCLFTHDTATARKLLPSIRRAVEYIKYSTAKDPYGLLPPAYPYDNEMIKGHYASNNFWALLGLRFAVRLTRLLGNEKEAASWITLEKQYKDNIVKGINASIYQDKYVPPGLYKYITGEKARKGFKEYQTNCDWENMLLLYPTEILTVSNPIINGTLSHIRKNYAEGIMTYRHGMHLHQYITANLIEQYMEEGDSRQALIDFYSLMIHCGSTYEGFENLVVPWTRTIDESCPPPHAWASAKIANLIRDFLIHEYGGDAGMYANKRGLDLFSVISPAWAKNGNVISINDAPVEMGKISSSIKFYQGSCTIHVKGTFSSSPAFIRFRIPYFKKMTSFKSNAKSSHFENGWIVVSPDVTDIKINWTNNMEMDKGLFGQILRSYRSTNEFKGVDSAGRAIIKPQVPFLLNGEQKTNIDTLSFDFMKNTFLYEYNRRRNQAD